MSQVADRDLKNNSPMQNIHLMDMFKQVFLVVRALNVRKGHTFSHLDKSMKFGTDDLHAILFQNFYGSNLRF